MDNPNEEGNPDTERREVLAAGMKALLAIGILGASVGLADRGALAGSCKACNGETVTCKGTPTCGIR